MPAYITRPFDPSFPVPARLWQGAALSLVTTGTRTRMQSLLDGWLNAASGSPFRFTVLSSFVAVTLDVGDLGVEPLAQTIPPKGQVPHQELAVAFAVLPWQQIDGGWQVCMPRWVMPFLAVSTAEAMATGREVLGWDKTTGSFDIDVTNTIDFTAFQAASLAWAQPGAFEVGRVLPIVSGTLRPDATPDDDRTLDLVAELVRRIDAGMPGSGHLPHPDIPVTRLSVEPAARGIVRLDHDAAIIDTKAWLKLPTQEVVNLKQFRDATDPTQACWMGLLDSPVGLAVTGVPNVWFDAWTLTFHDYASHPWTRWLGVQATSTSGLAFASSVTMNIGAGHALWTA